MAPREHRLTINGVALCVFEWGAEHRGRAESIVLSHATGFHARCWDRVVARLPDRHVVALDQRGHGRSTAVLPVRWADFGHDLAAVLRTLDLRDVVGVGHSMGGHATTEAAALAPDRFRRLVLIDPVIGTPEMYEGRFGVFAEGMHPTVKRRARWASPEEMFDRFRSRAPFDTWDPDVLRDYCTYGLRPDPAGDGFLLACAPEFEAQVYMASFGNTGIHDRVRAVGVPVLVVRAMEPPTLQDLRDFRYSPTWPGLAQEFQHGRELFLPDRSHFLPMEDPAFAAQLVLDQGAA